MKETISLKKARNIFPDKYTRLRAHDIIGRSVTYKKYLTPNERERLEKLALRIRDGQSFGLNADVLAIRNGRKIDFKKF